LPEEAEVVELHALAVLFHDVGETQPSLVADLTVVFAHPLGLRNIGEEKRENERGGWFGLLIGDGQRKAGKTIIMAHGGAVKLWSHNGKELHVARLQNKAGLLSDLASGRSHYILVGRLDEATMVALLVTLDRALLSGRDQELGLGQRLAAFAEDSCHYRVGEWVFPASLFFKLLGSCEFLKHLVASFSV